MNLLITGGAGFIGSNVVHQVIDRPEVTRLVNLDCLTYAGHLVNLEKVSRHPKYSFEKVDLRDKTAVFEVAQKHAITHVMHLAAESHVDRSITGPGDFIHTNVVGTFNLLEACRALWADAKFKSANPEVKCTARSARRDCLPSRPLTRPTRLTQQAKLRAIFWCARIITRTGCRR
jgi:dTDP-D-glucose 4,6-dehydratase